MFSFLVFLFVITYFALKSRLHLNFLEVIFDMFIKRLDEKLILIDRKRNIISSAIRGDNS